MNGWKKMLVLAGVATLCLAANEVMAGRGGGGGNGGNGFGGNGGGGGRGGRGNFDPAQQRQNQLDNYKADFEITDDAEWKVIGDAIGKVMDARDDLRMSQFSGFGRRGGRGGGAGGNNGFGGGNAATDPTATNNNNNNNTAAGGGRRQRGGGGPGGGNPSPELAALQAAVEAKAPTEDIKSRLTRVREVIKGKEDKLAAAQDALKQLLSTRQEGIAVLLGLLK